MNSIQTKAVSLGRAIDYLRLIESETRVTDESARKKNYYSTTNYEGKQKSINSKPYIGGKKKSRKKNKKKLKSRKKRQ